MNIKREHLKIIFDFDDKEEQEFWEKKFIKLAKRLDDDYKHDMDKDSLTEKNIIDMEIEEHEEKVEKLEKLKHKLYIAKDGIKKLVNLMKY